MTSRYRNIHILLSILFFTLCVLIVQYSHELGVWRGYIGDVVVIMFLYSLVQSVHRYPTKMVILWILLFSYLIEFLQYFHFATLMGWEEFSIMRLIFWSTFDLWDIGAYTIWGILMMAIDCHVRLFSEKKSVPTN